VNVGTRTGDKWRCRWTNVQTAPERAILNTFHRHFRLLNNIKVVLNDIKLNGWDKICYDLEWLRRETVVACATESLFSAPGVVGLPVPPIVVPG